MTDLEFGEYPKPVLERFKKFHSSNPQVYDSFKNMAQKMKAVGRKKYSARTIMEVIRWNYDLKVIGDVFDINNDFIPIYVRVLIHNHPEYQGFFELRKVRSRDILSQEQKIREAESL